MRQRRQAVRGRHAPPIGSKQNIAEREREQNVRRAIMLASGVVGALVILLVTAGFFFNVYQPPRSVVAQVGDEEIRLRDVPEYVRLYAMTTGNANVDPRLALDQAVRAKIYNWQASSLGVSAQQVDIDLELASLWPRRPYNPAPATDSSDGDDAPVAALTPEGRERYTKFLAAFDVTEEAYVEWLRSSINARLVRQHFESVQPAEMEQVRLKWIVAQDSGGAQKAKQRLDNGEAFEAVASSLNRDTTYADSNGDVGWFPKGILTELDDRFFAAEAGALVGPVQTQFGSMIIQVVEGPATQPVQDKFRAILGGIAADEWYADQWSDHVSRYNFDDSDAAWVISRV
ncbi:MAG: hypothetical protein FJ318_03145 [SAR202 cluster bacterium]|nr:hypothetical protein [SAR202 cluster bacterium]